MSSFDELKQKLREIFQLDHNELDFGLYRIMKLKADEISNFIENDLLNEVKEDLKAYADDDKVKIQQEIETKSKQIKESGLNPDDSPVIKQLKEKLKNTTSSQDIEMEIYSNLYDFFKRYYEGGDFLSLRRYKKDVYALPYEGEEVKLHWANADQYYIKSSEILTNYTFILKNKEKVRFEVVEANTEQNNNKGDRYFKLAEQNTIRKEGNEYIISFTYLPNDTKLSQKFLNEETATTLLENTVLAPIKKELSQFVDKENKVPLILKYITDFTAKNQFDYFIHKDLGGFLNRELDFYIKNEIMQIDDIENQSLENVNKYLGKIKVFRKIAHKIIQFLSSLENFQKKIWLKKKLILETNYCITLDKVPEQLYPQIIENKAQIQEWIKLFAIDEIKGEPSKVAYTEPLTVEFLKDNPHLVLDTAFFSNDFKYELLSSIDNIDEQCNGQLINSENFQALNLLQEKYNQKIDCIYIDPPYNTDSSPILYKNNYKDSSWICLMNDRLQISKYLMKESGIICQAIDDVESRYLTMLSDKIFNRENYITTITILCTPQGRVSDFSNKVSEYTIIHAKNKQKIEELLVTKSDESKKETNFRRAGMNSSREERPRRYYPLLIKNEKYIEMIKFDEYKRIYNEDTKTFNEDFLLELKNKYEALGYKLLYPETGGKKYVWQREFSRAMNEYKTYTYRNNNVFTPAFEEETPKTLWNKNVYSNATYGTKLLNDIIKQDGYDASKNTPKSVYVVQDFIGLNNADLTLDFFAGSGTTGHSVINLNRQDNGNRKYILCEMGNYFDTVTKPRIEKVIYSKDWKDGKPVSREGSSHCFKYIRLESYEDCLDNLKFSNSQATLPQEVKQDYMLNYMLDLETKDSLLNIKDFNHPFDYKLKITRNGEAKEVTVDLVETFNYLLGLTVESIQKIRDVIKIEGKSKNGEKTLIIWRDTTKTDNQKLDDWFKKINDSPRSSEFDVIYVNGDNNLENLRKENDTWKVRLIEESFLRSMFDVKDI